ncbi:transcriptional regulator, LysR family [Xanthomonas bromi]|uniref:Transcriptional regulator, LysR family n=1 Tax=Xanthomonas bromi TaxID=56449 RepID=A0A1C3NHN5_9XANT|nr:transcriptional regulator, LysR family [Xanthomonas bromi]
MEISGTDRRVDVVREGFDCVLRVGTLEDTSLVARPLGAFRIVSCASAQYLARRGTPHCLDDPASPLRAYLDSGALIEILPDLAAEPMPVTLLYAQRRHLPQRVRAFMDWVAELMAPHLRPLVP